VLVPDAGACGGEGAAPCPSPDQKEQPPAAAAAEEQAGALKTGSRAPGFTLRDVKGKNLKFDPKALKKPALLVFWSLFCEPCKEELPLFGWLGEKYAGEGLQVVGVNLDGANMAGAAARFFKMNKLSFPTGMDRKEGKRFVTAEAYAVTGTPSLFLVGTDGKIGWTHVGRVEAANLEAAVRTALGL
jgi:thiol-disulfide isomerase/thioredoxin